MDVEESNRRDAVKWLKARESVDSRFGEPQVCRRAMRPNFRLQPNPNRWGCLPRQQQGRCPSLRCRNTGRDRHCTVGVSVVDQLDRSTGREVPGPQRNVYCSILFRAIRSENSSIHVRYDAQNAFCRFQS